VNAFGTSPVIPVAVIDRVADAVPLARALHAGGIDVIEVTLRTATALDAVRAITAEVEGVRVGVGTVLTPGQAETAVRAGAGFLVTPGVTERLLDALEDSGVPFLAGTATPSDMIRVLDRGITVAKLFPAEPAGGIALLRSVAGPFPQLRFCPTGGITESSAADYLALGNVMCVGGSWLTPRDAIEQGDWSRVQALAEGASGLGRRSMG
jgi:2-dehydro-3-deoxyphosphogluconate aldolase/(4S)-4-hydroxy-2-oxoglutarate aldolase